MQLSHRLRASHGTPRSTAAVTRRLAYLFTGLALYGVSAALMLRAGLGLDPWNVFHEGIARHTGLSIGTVAIIAGACVLLLWAPLRQMPGLGTVANVVVIGLVMNATLEVVPTLHPMAGRIPLLAAAITLNGLATGMYISARFGAGPRDGLMTGLHRRTGYSIRLVRTAIELAVLVTGFLLGGSFGVGTVAYALAIGPLAQVFLKLFTRDEPSAAADTGPRPEGDTASENAAVPLTGGAPR